MNPFGYTLIATLLTTVCAVLLYLASPNQGLRPRAWPARPTIAAGAIALIAAMVFWVIAWGGLVGGLFALTVWMLASTILPFLFPRRA